jgi:hypothetical protein
MQNTKPSDKDQEYIPRLLAAERLHCSDQLIDKFIRQKKLTAYHLGRKVVVRWSDCLRLLEEIQ